MRKVLAIAAAAMILTSCYKNWEFNAQIHLVSRVQKSDGGPASQASGFTLYVYEGRHNTWGALSWEDAMSGNAVNSAGEPLLKIGTSVPNSAATSGEIVAPLLSEEMVMLAIDTARMLIAQKTLILGPDEMEVRDTMLWKEWETSTYDVGQWTVIPEADFKPIVVNVIE